MKFSFIQGSKHVHASRRGDDSFGRVQIMERRVIIKT